jgi:hypothetical protein
MSASTEVVETAFDNNLLMKVYRKWGGRIMQTKLLEQHSACVGHDAALLN